MRTCMQCRFAIKMRVAFDYEPDFCGHPSARINGEPVGFVTGEEADFCGCYEEGRPTIEDELVTIKPHLIPVHSAAGFTRVGN